MSHQGAFLDVIGLSYRCGSTEGTTSSEFLFNYDLDTLVTFSIGSLVMGGAMGKLMLTISDLLPAGTPISDPRLINRARLLYSFSSAQGFEKAITIDTEIENIVSKYASEIDLDSPDPSNLDDILSKICGEIGIIPKTVSHARNHLRREEAGFKVMRDIQIPVRDGEFVLGDVYLPLGLGKKYPVLLSCHIYGKRVICSGPNTQDAKDIAAFEIIEDNWNSVPAGVELEVPDDRVWSGNWISQRGFENIAAFNTSRYVPRGYVMVKIDPRGVVQTPGIRGVPGQLATDFFDAIEWASEQPWSNGTSALVGSSYGANLQWNVVQMRPKGLKCFVPYAMDLDVYREAAYPGGIPTFRYLEDWFDRVKRASTQWNDAVDLFEVIKKQPFHNQLWESLSVKPEAAGLPCFLAASQIFIIHGRGAFEAWRAMDTRDSHLQLVDRDYYAWPSNETSGKILQFLDRNLQGHENPSLEKVGIQMRLGNKQWYWRSEKDWPVPGTQYTRWYLVSGGLLSTSFQSEPEAKHPYSTKIHTNTTKSGISFSSLPFEQDMEFAGHFTANLNVSSSARDADFVVSLWIVDKHGNVVPLGAKGEPEPLAKGFLRASHRKQDPLKSLPERPWFTHTQEDNAPLGMDEVVPLQIEIFPAAARISKGCALRVDITPTEDQPDIPGYQPLQMREFYSEVNEEGQDAIHIGGDHVNYITCPVVPYRQGYPNVIV